MLKDEIINKVKDLANRLSQTMKPRDRKILDESEKLSQKFSQQKKEDIVFSAQDAEDQSLEDSQGINRFTGSGYHGAGNIDREKTNSNMRQTNFENSKQD